MGFTHQAGLKFQHTGKNMLGYRGFMLERIADNRPRRNFFRAGPFESCEGDLQQFQGDAFRQFRHAAADQYLNIRNPRAERILAIVFRPGFDLPVRLQALLQYRVARAAFRLGKKQAMGLRHGIFLFLEAGH